ncbi:MAG: 4Fe-4S dicluster domain-containing protein [Bacteroidetes bacterium]|nr:4Fe-4S dicluster domain-containing protein [Bacteroidota bacterium]
MSSQLIFTIVLILSFGFFGYTAFNIFSLFRNTKKISRLDHINERITTTLLVAFGQKKMFKRPIAGILHATVWWGFLVVTIGTVEMMIDGISGTERVLSSMGGFYDLVTASGEIFAVLIILACVIFLIRRYIITPARFKAREMKPSSRMDATMILAMILILMVSLLGMNLGYYVEHPGEIVGSYPVSKWIVINFQDISSNDMSSFYTYNWWIHIVVVLLFMNILPYSKHFHVIMAVPNVFLSRQEPMAKLDTMESVTKEVKLMMDPNTAFAPPPEGAEAAAPPSFGIKDVNDATWKNLLDAYTCTECGRCTEVCPASNTGKMLSPRKLMIDLRAKVKKGSKADHGLIHENFITEEELWACTSCMACMEECPVNIDHVPFIIDMRRNLVMEESKVPPELAMMFNNIENNGAPWQFNQSDRMKWTEELTINES